jgi:hypothetical protein
MRTLAGIVSIVVIVTGCSGGGPPKPTQLATGPRTGVTASVTPSPTVTVSSTPSVLSTVAACRDARYVVGVAQSYLKHWNPNTDTFDHTLADNLGDAGAALTSYATNAGAASVAIRRVANSLVALSTAMRGRDRARVLRARRAAGSALAHLTAGCPA